MVSRRKTNKKLIGLFALAGLVLFFAIISILLSDKIFVKKNNLFVLYFSEPVRNLSIGSPVMFSGVEIGKVAKIDLIVDRENFSFEIPVYININFDEIFKTTDNEKIENKKLFIEKLVEKGLKGKLSSYSMITGQLMIELEILPDVMAEKRDNNFNNGDIQEIPTTLSSKGQLTKGLQDLPIKEIIEKIDGVLATFNKYLPPILENSNSFIDKMNEYSSKSDGIQELVDKTGETLNNIGEAAKSLHNFLDYIERNPESLLKGKNNY